jgi:hypothetical protein
MDLATHIILFKKTVIWAQWYILQNNTKVISYWTNQKILKKISGKQKIISEQLPET